MATTHRKILGHNKSAMGSVAAGVAGAVALAGVAVAATMVMQDEKTRGKVRNVLMNAKDKAIDYIDTFKTESNTKKGVNTIKKIVNDTKNVLEKEI